METARQKADVRRYVVTYPIAKRSYNMIFIIDVALPKDERSSHMRATVTDVFRNFSDYINRVSYRGERFVLTRGGRAVAELGPTASRGRRLSELPDILDRLPRLGEAEAELFASDLERVREESGLTTPKDPWES